MFNCMYICTYVIGYVKIILKSIVSHKSKRTGYQICLFLMYIYMYLICDTQINYKTSVVPVI